MSSEDFSIPDKSYNLPIQPKQESRSKRFSHINEYSSITALFKEVLYETGEIGFGYGKIPGFKADIIKNPENTNKLVKLQEKYFSSPEYKKLIKTAKKFKDFPNFHLDQKTETKMKTAMSMIKNYMENKSTNSLLSKLKKSKITKDEQLLSKYIPIDMDISD